MPRLLAHFQGVSLQRDNSNVVTDDSVILRVDYLAVIVVKLSIFVVPFFELKPNVHDHALVNV